MSILVCGINHKTAPVALREQVIFAPEKIPLYLNDLVVNENLRDAILFSTCNRSELYCEADDISKVIAWFCRQHAILRSELEPALYVYRDEQAIEHIMNVACGLDSMVLGESQILGQMKTAFSEGCAAGSVDTLFNRLFQQVFAVAKEVRNTTSIGACPVSVSSAAVNFIKQTYTKNLTAATILLIGAGETIEIVLRYLKTLAPQQLLIANRNMEKAFLLTEKYAAENVLFADLPKALKRADIVVSATGSTQPLVTKDMLAKCDKPIFIVDIAVPRDIAADAATLPHVQLFSIDDLKENIQKNFSGREHAAEKAREMIKKKCHEFMAWLESFDKVATTIRVYRKQVEDLCQGELIKAQRQLRRGDDPADVLASFAYALTNKLLHHPSVQLRQAGFEGRFEILQLAQQLFAIPEVESEAL